jgi:multidrug efflux pump subunit AcrA (membrane-fusion protein)
MEQQWQSRLKLAKAESAMVAPQILSTGRVIAAPKNQAVVAPAVGGVIGAGIVPVVGQKVERGETLAVLTETLTAAELAQASRDQAQFDLQAAQFDVQAAQLDFQAAQLQSDKAQYELQANQLRIENARIEAERRRLTEAIQAGQIRRDLAKTEFDRATRLFEKKAYSQKQLQEAESAYKAASAAITELTAQRDALTPISLPAPAPSAPAPAARPVRTLPPPPSLPTTTRSITSPISGVIVKVHKSAGEHVQAGEPLFEIVNLETVWVEAPIFEKDLARLKNGRPAVFSTAAFPDLELRGRLVDIAAVIDDRTRAASAIFEVPNAERKLRIGMQANVRLDAEESVAAVLVPKEAVLDNEGKKIVYVLLSGEEFQRVEVTLGSEYGDKVAILSGIAAGQRVVTQGAYQLKLQELRPANPGAHTHEV